MNRSYANFAAQKIETACIRYAVHSRVCESDSPASGAVPGRCIGREMVGRLAEIATHMIFDDNGLGKWIDTLEGAREFLKSVLTYRILLGCAKPQDVLDDFEADCPPWSTGTKPIIVDLIAWPSLRDQMMFHSSFYDLDEMTEDVINYTVVDIPEHKIALQLYNSPPTRFPTVPRPEESTYQSPFKFSQRENTIKIAQLQNQDLYDIIARRMDSPVGEDGVASTCRGIPGSPQAECLRNNAEPVKRVKGWKLSGAFFKKYPFLQCSSLASRYPFCPSSKLPRV
ncbi:hypothetical protein MPH_05308 [Macrophomina phaseolina MS6]|uniref:Uncharacterized protein n=2 Tax=Macrophomina phaseolina TaxID=35725 RepID=K2S4J2_MACPH|nr:hypothetical protein MPH_05308 [Macrophomina phaseolina MS6]